MAAKKPKTVEITLRVRVPADWSAAHAKHEVSSAWYGEIYALGPPTQKILREEVSLFPRWSKARVVKKGA
jgi:hypothetical protein